MFKHILGSILPIALIIVTNLNIVVAAPLAEIQKRGRLIVGVKENLRPLGFRGENGQLQGLEIDIAKKLAAEILGDETAIEFVPVKNQDRLKLVLEDQVDFTIAGVSLNESRARVVDFSPYYYVNGTALISKNSVDKILTRNTTTKIAVLNGSDTITTMKNIFPQAQLVEVKSYEEAYNLLENNTVEYLAADKTILTGWVQEYPQYQLLPQTFSREYLAIVMPKGLQYLELRTQVNESISRWHDNWLPERVKYWGL